VLTLWEHSFETWPANRIISKYIRAFVFSGGTMFELGSLPDEYDTSTYAYGINDAGQVVGRCQTPSVPYAVLWQPR
jgi:uncharacterized membrane protein